MPTDSFRSINPNQIPLIFESMKYYKNDQEQEKLFLTLFFCFHATYFYLDTWCFVVIQGDHV